MSLGHRSYTIFSYENRRPSYEREWNINFDITVCVPIIKLNQVQVVFNEQQHISASGQQTTASVSVNLCRGTKQVLTSHGTGCMIEVGLYSHMVIPRPGL